MKHLASTILVAILFAFAANAQTVVESGKFEFNNSQTGYMLDKNQGERVLTFEVKFKNPFATKPQIVIALTKIDANNQKVIRLKVEPSFITNEGFIVKAMTWGDSMIHGIGGNWMAITTGTEGN